MAGSRGQEPLHVAAMAIALTLAAFTGAALGLVWQSAGFAEEAAADPEAQLAAEPAAAEAD